MNWKAKGYIAIILLAGVSILGELPTYWRTDDLLRLVVFALLALLTSAWKISIPGVRGTMSANFLFVLVGAVQLSQGETLTIAMAGVVAQYFYRAKAKGGHRLVQAAFNLSSVAIAVRITTGLYSDVLPAFPALEFPFRLTLTAIAYFVCNTMPVSIIISLTEEKPLLPTWKTCFFWSFPYYLMGAAISGLLWKVSEYAGWQTSVLIVPVVYLIYRSYELYLGRLEAEKRQVEVERNHAEEMASLHLRTIQALALAIEAKDQTTHDHLQRVQLYCTEVGKELGLADEEMQALLAASVLHDIGKLAVPEHIISKPGKLTPEEFEKMKIHPVVGAEILEHVKFPYPVTPIVRHHHEKWDGSGYPDGIAGKQIPIGSRILSAVDCFDALSSDRQYRPALPVDKAMAIVQMESGRAFDPEIVTILGRRYRQLEEMVRQQAPDRVKLSVDIKVERGDAPAAGFEAGTESSPEPVEFVTSIGAARNEAQFLYAISEEMNLAKDARGLLTGLSAKLQPLVPFDTMAYYQLGPKTLSPIFADGVERELYGRLQIPVGQGLSGWVAETKKTIRNGNPAVEPGYLNDRTVMTNMRSSMSVPVEGASGVIGVFSLYHSARDFYSKEHLRIFLAVASRIAYPLETLMRVQKAQDDATTDELTGLPNSRRLLADLEEACNRAERNSDIFSLVVFDLDGFKKLNDTHGHLMGNRALQEIAGRAKARLRDSASLSRMGGDEFVLLLPGRDESETLAEAVQFQRLVEQAGEAVVNSSVLSASWGIATYRRDGKTPEELVAEADRRMYEYKSTKDQRMALRLTRLAQSLQIADGDQTAEFAARVIQEGP